MRIVYCNKKGEEEKMEHYEVMYTALCEYAERRGFSIERKRFTKEELTTLITPGNKYTILPTDLLSLAMESIKGRNGAGCFVRNDIETTKPQLCIYWKE